MNYYETAKKVQEMISELLGKCSEFLRMLGNY